MPIDWSSGLVDADLSAVGSPPFVCDVPSDEIHLVESLGFPQNTKRRIRLLQLVVDTDDPSFIKTIRIDMFVLKEPIIFYSFCMYAYKGCE